MLLMVALQQLIGCRRLLMCPTQVADFKDFWAAAQAAGYEAYVAEPPETDPQVRLGCSAAVLPTHAVMPPTPLLLVLLCAASRGLRHGRVGMET